MNSHFYRANKKTKKITLYFAAASALFFLFCFVLLIVLEVHPDALTSCVVQPYNLRDRNTCSPANPPSIHCNYKRSLRSICFHVPPRLFIVANDEHAFCVTCCVPRSRSLLLRRTRCCAVRYDGVWRLSPLLSFVLGFFFSSPLRFLSC